MSSKNIAAIILAAGSSSRMGQPKQLLNIQGEPLLLRTVNAVIKSKIKKTVVVVGAFKEQIERILSPCKIDVIINDDWKKGLGNSLKLGLQHLRSDTGYDGIFIFVCDQPSISSNYINEVIKKYEENDNAIIASFYADTLGVPALFPSSYLASLLKLDDTEGAKKLINQFSDSVLAVSLPEGEIDIDTLDDYYNYINKF
jgi:molybdenum cofactor cytidylyltransferase